MSKYYSEAHVRQIRIFSGDVSTTWKAISTVDTMMIWGGADFDVKFEYPVIANSSREAASQMPVSHRNNKSGLVSCNRISTSGKLERRSLMLDPHYQVSFSMLGVGVLYLILFCVL